MAGSDEGKEGRPGGERSCQTGWSVTRERQRLRLHRCDPAMDEVFPPGAATDVVVGAGGHRPCKAVPRSKGRRGPGRRLARYAVVAVGVLPLSGAAALPGRSPTSRPPRLDRVNPCRGDSRPETISACHFCIDDSMPGLAHSDCAELARPCPLTAEPLARRTQEWPSPRQLSSQWPEPVSSRVLHLPASMVWGRITLAHR